MMSTAVAPLYRPDHLQQVRELKNKTKEGDERRVGAVYYRNVGAQYNQTHAWKSSTQNQANT